MHPRFAKALRWILAVSLIVIVLYICIAPTIDLPWTTLRALTQAVLLFALLRSLSRISLLLAPPVQSGATPQVTPLWNAPPGDLCNLPLTC